MRLHHVKERPVQERPAEEQPLAPATPQSLEQIEHDKDEQSLDLVQRIVASVLALVIGGGIAVLLSTLTALNALDLSPGSQLGLWVMGGVAGVLTAAAILVINRRHPYSPLLVLGLIPMALSAYWVLT